MMYSMCVVYWAYSSSAHSLEANDHAAHSVDNGIWLASLTTDSGSCQLQLHCFATLYASSQGLQRWTLQTRLINM